MNTPAIPEKPDIVVPQLQGQTISVSALPSSGSNQSFSKKSNKKMFAIIGVILLTITTLSGFLLIARPILFNSNAWNCGAYTFSLSKTGLVSVQNGSSNNEPFQRADVFINNQLTKTYDVPALSAGQNKTLGTVEIPSASFSWQIKGTSDCSNAGRVDILSTSYQCQNIRAYKTDSLNPLTASELASLTAGTSIRIVAKGTGLATGYQAARFTINGTLQTEVTNKTTDGDFYQLYVIPANTKDFNISAQLKATDGNWY